MFGINVPIRIPITTLIAMMTGVKREEFFVLMSIPFLKRSSYLFVLLFVRSRLFIRFCIDNFDSCPL